MDTVDAAATAVISETAAAVSAALINVNLALQFVSNCTRRKTVSLRVDILHRNWRKLAGAVYSKPHVID